MQIKLLKGYIFKSNINIILLLVDENQAVTFLPMFYELRGFCKHFLHPVALPSHS